MFFFFFKQKTAYEMRISDWSSDVCSSDLRKGFNVLSFANNHCMHAGYRAFLRTMELMRESGISPVGGGKNIVEALAPVYLESNGVKVAFVGCTAAMLPGTHAGRRTPGVAPLRRHSYYPNPNWNDWGLTRLDANTSEIQPQ